MANQSTVIPHPPKDPWLTPRPANNPSLTVRQNLLILALWKGRNGHVFRKCKQRIQVYWEGDDKWYSGCVMEELGPREMFIEYDDYDVGTIDTRYTTYQINMGYIKQGQNMPEIEATWAFLA